MIIIVTGTPGSGKTKTVKQLMESTPHSASIDGDPFLSINPFSRAPEERELQYKNIASVAKNYYEAGYKTIFISFVYGQSQLNLQRELLKDIDNVEVFVLITNEEELRKRHTNDSYVREDIESSLELNNNMAKLENAHIIDNTNISIEEVAEYIKKSTDLS